MKNSELAISKNCGLYIGSAGLEHIAQKNGKTTMIGDIKHLTLEKDMPKEDWPEDHEDWRIFSEMFAKSDFCEEFHVYLALQPHSWNLRYLNDGTTYADMFHLYKIFFRDEMLAMLENLSVKKVIFKPILGYTAFHKKHIPKNMVKNVTNTEHYRELENIEVDLKDYRTKNVMGLGTVREDPQDVWGDAYIYSSIKPVPLNFEKDGYKIFQPTPDGRHKEGRFNPMNLRKKADTAICALAKEYLNPQKGDLERFSWVTANENLRFSHDSRSERFEDEISELEWYAFEGRNMIESFQRSARLVLADEELCPSSKDVDTQEPKFLAQNPVSSSYAIVPTEELQFHRLNCEYGYPSNGDDFVDINSDGFILLPDLIKDIRAGKFADIDSVKQGESIYPTNGLPPAKKTLKVGHSLPQGYKVVHVSEPVWTEWDQQITFYVFRLPTHEYEIRWTWRQNKINHENILLLDPKRQEYTLNIEEISDESSKNILKEFHTLYDADLYPSIEKLRNVTSNSITGFPSNATFPLGWTLNK